MQPESRISLFVELAVLAYQSIERRVDVLTIQLASPSVSISEARLPFLSCRIVEMQKTERERLRSPARPATDMMND